MASSKDFLDFVMDQISDLDDVASRPMMGEYVIYYQGKVVGGIYDNRFLLKESIAKGLLLVVPNDAPNIAKLRKWVLKVKDGGLDESGEALDFIEKYAYQNASGYELFLDRWLTTSELLAHLPSEREELEKQLRQKDEIEISDSLNTYIIRVTDKMLLGSPMPLEYARPEIERIVLSRRQTEFLQKERERLYNEAIQEKKIIFF